MLLVRRFKANMKFAHSVLCSVVLLLGTLHHCQGANVTAIRLVNTTSEGRFGRLEIQINGVDTWGVVCDDSWKDNEANAIVACRQLGFTNGGTANLNDLYGRGTGPFLLDDTVCAAFMTSLAQCSSAQQHDCGNSDKVVGLECNADSGGAVTTFQPPTISTIPGGQLNDNCNNPSSSPVTVKLFGTVDGIGFVQVQHPVTNVFGFVCDDGWDSLAARVVCAQLCFPTNYTAKPGIPSEHRSLPTSPTIILDDISCTGTEATLQDCSHNNFADTNDCSGDNGELAGVQCVSADYSPPAPPDPLVECGGGEIQVSFSLARDAKLEEKHLSVLADPNCPDVSKSTTSDFVIITIPVDKCGTNISRNGTHIIYETDIFYASTSEQDAITRVNSYKVEVLCALPVGKTVTQRVQPVTELVTEKADGIITAAMAIYRSDSFQNAVTENPVRVPVGEWLNMAVGMEQYDNRLKLVVTDCVATPGGDTSNTRLTKELFINKCVVESSLSFYPLSQFEFAFRFRLFKFVNFPIFYIQCNAVICLDGDVTAECDRTCNNTKPASSGRKKRSVMHQQVVESPAILVYEPEEEEEIVIDVGNLEPGNDDKTSQSSTSRSTQRVTVTTLQPTQQETPQTPSPPSLETSSSMSSGVPDKGDDNNSGISTDEEVIKDNEDNLDSSDKGNNSSRLTCAEAFVFSVLLCIFTQSYLT